MSSSNAFEPEPAAEKPDVTDTLVNGEPGRLISIHDRGLQFGDGVFETIAVQEGEPLCREAHLARLEEGCRRLSIACPDRNLLEHEINELCGPLESAVLKIIITRGTGGRGYQAPEKIAPSRILAIHDRPDYPSEYYREGIPSYVCSRRLAHHPDLAGIKHLNRLEQVLLSHEVAAAPCPEGIVLDPGGNVIEGSRSNLFMVKDGELITPDLSRCGVAGVIRESIIRQHRDEGIETDVRDITLEEVYEADEVFYCNSVIGVWPVRSIGNKKYGIDAGLEIMRKLVSENLVFRTTSRGG